jgi:hypothetical protein
VTPNYLTARAEMWNLCNVLCFYWVVRSERKKEKKAFVYVSKARREVKIIRVRCRSDKFDKINILYYSYRNNMFLGNTLI